MATEVTTEPARANLDRFLDTEGVRTAPPLEPADGQAREILGEEDINGDIRLVGVVIAHRDVDDVGIVSDDRRVRTITRGLGATVTGTISTLIRGVAQGLDTDEGRRILHRLDEHGLHMTGELRERAINLIEDAGEK